MSDAVAHTYNYIEIRNSWGLEKISIRLEDDALKWIDSQIKKKRFANRTHAIRYAIEQLRRGE